MKVVMLKQWYQVFHNMQMVLVLGKGFYIKVACIVFVRHWTPDWSTIICTLHIGCNLKRTCNGIWRNLQGRIQKFPDWVDNEIRTINTRWDTTQSVMVAKLTRPTHKIVIQLHLMAESCTICSSGSRRPVQKLLDTPSKHIYVSDRFPFNSGSYSWIKIFNSTYAHVFMYRWPSTLLLFFFTYFIITLHYSACFPDGRI
jgi:hypothetical protein